MSATDSYRVNEIFYSLQGEGFWTGTPAVFVRFSGCNLRCPFCDTAHERFDTLSADAIIAAIAALLPAASAVGAIAPAAPACSRTPHTSAVVVLTGGEPGLQVDAALVEKLHGAGYRVHIETNGTRELPPGIDWVTLSPKAGGAVVLERADEVKLLFEEGMDPAILDRWAAFPATWHFLQPCDIQPAASSLREGGASAARSVRALLSAGLSTHGQGQGEGPARYEFCEAGRSRLWEGPERAKRAESRRRQCPDAAAEAQEATAEAPESAQGQTQRNTEGAIEYIKSHPQWRLSLQIHKLIGIR